ncbi:hypothetical protein VTN77DRAFT_9608 [Rasamsonia byssochlamydoides]|uniref:uncharacterized protein n=1 Tax=Rasamsonia byssochlamydoides TaxID=89139 RepID=UPI0037422081
MDTPSRSDHSEPTQWTEKLETRPSIDSSGDSVVEQQNQETPRHGNGDKILTPQVTRTSQPSLARRTTSIGTTDPNFEVDWDDEKDPENPRNWSLAYRAMCVVFLSWNTLVIVLYSTSYTSGISDIAVEFGTSETIVTLGLTFYLIGLAMGSVVVAPLSETYGRKPVSVISLFIFVIMIIPCALATSVTELIIVRFIAALAGSVMISSAPGMVGDLVDDDHRGLALSIWSLGPINGPVLGPIVGGFVTQYLGWRWTAWISLILSGVALVFSCIMKETYAPVLLRKKAARIRKETDDPRWWSRYDHKVAFSKVVKTNLSRPFALMVLEPICIFWNLYIGVVYGILYLCFTAYPIVFQQIRGWSIGLSGLAFVGIGIGTVLTIAAEPLIRRMINSHQVDPETGKVPPEAMMSVVCISALLIPAGELWFAWTCSPASIPWVLPILAGVPFGAGNTAVFIYAANYLAHSYGIYAASALASNSVIRSILGGIMPLVGTYMYNNLGPNWSGTLLGLLEVAIIPIPFVFWKYGYKIRRKSEFIRAMQEDKKKMDGKRSRKQQRVQEQEQGENPAPALMRDDPEKQV